MKLLRLQLPEGFRSLPAGFEVRFLREESEAAVFQFNPYCLVGRNGSGKSNLLEALAAIFYHLECTYLYYRPEAFEANEDEVAEFEAGEPPLDIDDAPEGFYSKRSYPDTFELEYLYKVTPELISHQGETLTSLSGVPLSANPQILHVRVKKEKLKSPVFYSKEWRSEADMEIVKERESIKEILPSFILGYSSGENEILSLPFFKMRLIHYDEYLEKLTKGLSYGGAPEGRMVYLDEALSQAILLCNFLFQNDDVLSPFKEEVGLEEIKEFRIILKNDIEEILIDESLERTLTKEQLKDDRNLKVYLTELLEETIEKLFNCSTSYFMDIGSGVTYIDFWVNEETKKAFRFHFNSALELFQLFQLLITLNLHVLYGDEETKEEIYKSNKLYISKSLPTAARKDRVMRFGDFLIRKQGVSDLIYSQSLSDGEHQFLHTLGLCLLFKDEPCLFLLDEPETHLNPDWRSKFISRLRDCFKHGNAEGVMREMLITSHSPFIVSDSKSENVLLFERSQDGIVSYHRPEFKTFGASVNQITINIFDKPSTIGGYAQQQLEDLEKRFEAGEDGEKLIEEANQLLGDSVEKILFIDKVLDTLEDTED